MTSSTTDFAITRNESPKTEAERAEILANPGFGVHFTDHMATVEFTEEQGWHSPRVEPYGPLQLDPAACVLHYAQEIFEGMKAYRHADGSVWTFRPEKNAARMRRSAERLALPQVPEDVFLEAIKELVKIDEVWVPDASTGEASLYLRPFEIATEAFLGVRPAKEARYCVIASPAGPYFPSGVKPVDIWVSRNYHRAAFGGTGFAKCGGNYAGSMAAQVEAAEHGCAQVMFLDDREEKWVEELGGMNLFFAFSDGRIVTPPTGGTILEGVTRMSLVELARDAGHEVEERPISIDEVKAGIEDGSLTEVFACGTAAVITPVGSFKDGDDVWTVGGEGRSEELEESYPVTMKLRTTLTDLQYGRAEDTKGWLVRLV
ncbi:branched chain amino acid aminotransferase apoenzyme [Kytococcus aerolatus]|uniref:Branched-chain-amino-acid aminotransferase n=1 Tax=Kytococcus aerolatus TaxID=592308 RepID=A0A212U0U8_9MICO|nr:branched-chain amino acid aminotransferase [Kytococcus aerolatus]SNC71872.1 branched chain amino acid aminotransferase apoenzyme [Kytococcus aerolatus]